MDIDRKIAILVDGDNAQAKSLEPILTEVAKYGKATIRRIYGDWTTPNMQSWKTLINGLSFQPIQQFAYTTGKNSTDGALIIDAMDILHSESVEGFCIVSSDSDFTRLAARIREAGVLVIGIGKKQHQRHLFNHVSNLFLSRISCFQIQKLRLSGIPQHLRLRKKHLQKPKV